MIDFLLFTAGFSVAALGAWFVAVLRDKELRQAAAIETVVWLEGRRYYVLTTARYEVLTDCWHRMRSAARVYDAARPIKWDTMEEAGLGVPRMPIGGGLDVTKHGNWNRPAIPGARPDHDLDTVGRPLKPGS